MRFLCTCLAILASLAASASPGVADPPTSSQVQSASRQVLELVNEARAQRRRCGWKRFDAVPPLALSGVLNRVALEHARDMAERQTLGHAGRDGSTPGERATRAGYPWRAVGENIASGQSSAEQVVADWLKSSHHCANLMDPDYSEMGVGFAVAPQGEGRMYWSQVFAAPRPAS
jgi:uncharacterized protein YkwD